MARIKGIQAILTSRRHSGLIKLEARLRRELDVVLHQEELLWFQKARVDWLKDEDRNTTFFQLCTVVRRWRSKITSIKNSNDEWIFNKDEVQREVVNYFAELFTDDGSHGVYDIPTGVSTEFSNADWDSLNRPYSKCDIDYVVKHMGPMKAPGPDGFQALFYQKNWELVAPNV